MTTMTRDTTRPWTVGALTALLGFQGVSAVGGGVVLLVDTSGDTAGLDAELLAATPFTTFLWPALLLALGLGIPALVAAGGVYWRWSTRRAAALERATGHHWSWTISIVLGIALMVWIGVQVLLIDFSWLQPVMFATGAGLTVLPLTGSARRDLAGRS